MPRYDRVLLGDGSLLSHEPALSHPPTGLPTVSLSAACICLDPVPAGFVASPFLSPDVVRLCRRGLSLLDTPDALMPILGVHTTICRRGGSQTRPLGTLGMPATLIDTGLFRTDNRGWRSVSSQAVASRFGLFPARKTRHRRCAHGAERVTQSAC